MQSVPATKLGIDRLHSYGNVHLLDLNKITSNIDIKHIRECRNSLERFRFRLISVLNAGCIVELDRPFQSKWRETQGFNISTLWTRTVSEILDGGSLNSCT